MSKRKMGKFIFPQGTEVEQIYAALRQLGLTASAASFEFHAEKMMEERGTYLNFLRGLLEHEFAEKEEARLNRWLSSSKMSEVKRVGDFEFGKQPSIDPVMIHELASGRFIDAGKNVLFLGGPGVGKTHLALALGYEAIDRGYEVRYVTHSEFDSVGGRSADASIPRLYESLMRPELVIFDDLDYFNTNAESGKFLFDVIKQRFERKLSVMITSNVAPADWGNLFGLPRRNAPILDRLLDHTRRIVISIDGSSYRVPEKPTASNVSVDKPGETSTAQDAGLLRRLGDALSHKTSPDSPAG